MRNNPVLYSDPTGNKEQIDDGGCQNLNKCKTEFLRRRASEIVKSLKRNKDRDDLEAMAQIVDTGARIFKDYDELMPALSGIFLGIEESNSLTVWNAAFGGADPCAAVGRDERDCPANAQRGAFGDAGFNRDFQDGFSQPFHFWAYVATAANTEGKGPASYVPGQIIGNAANITHEMIWPDGPGATWQDFALARAGMNIGTLVNMGMVPPDQLGNTIRTYVGAGGPGAFYVDPLKFILPLEGNR